MSSEAQLTFLQLVAIVVLAALALYAVAGVTRLDDRLTAIESRLTAIEGRLGR
jgi:hypothetical protein